MPRRCTLPYELTLHPTYYNRGFFNLGVDVESFVRKDSGPAVLFLADSKTWLDVKVSREANRNGTPRVYGGSKLRDWFQSACKHGECLSVRILSPSEYWVCR
ncbi:MAG: hypothetical protein LBI31_06695 [Zoogloeaceae bacterium]|nr:hypothetical protein [Zoogloeaceae bacterium]